MTDNFFLRDAAIAYRLRMAESLPHRNIEHEAQGRGRALWSQPGTPGQAAAPGADNMTAATAASPVVAQF